MQHSLFGLETEFGCLIRRAEAGPPERVVELLKDHAFVEAGLGVMDQHTRDGAFEQAGAGGFILNGGRLYVDSVGDHLEYATPECTDLDDIVRSEKAGHAIITDLLRATHLEGRVSFHNNSVDHFGGHTFGSHENYLIAADVASQSDFYEALLPFLVTRQIFAGAGRVGGHKLVHPKSPENIMRMTGHVMDYLWLDFIYGVGLDPTVEFQLSQRADHIVTALSTRVRFNRALVNPKYDSLFDDLAARRLHLLFGEANMSEYATKLKIGTTALVLRLLECDAGPGDVALTRPVQALRAISRDPSWRWLVTLDDGRTIGAVDLQREYLRQAQAVCAGTDDEDIVWTLREWEIVLATLERDPLELADRLDWPAKRRLYEEYLAAEGGDWQDEMLQSLDLEYHHLDPAQSLYGALVSAGRMRREVPPESVARAQRSAPRNTRAFGRGLIVADLVAHPRETYDVDWDVVSVDHAILPLRRPHHTYEREARAFLARA